MSELKKNVQAKSTLSEPGLINLETAFIGLAISITSKKPTLLSGATFNELELDEHDRKVINLINRHYNPDTLMKVIFEKKPFIYAVANPDDRATLIMIKPPGKIIITPPSKEDANLAKNIIKIHEKLSINQKSGLERIISASKSFLSASKITDGFDESDINRRSLWAFGILNVLNELKNDVSNKHEYDWSTVFNNIWNNNRYSQGKRTALYSNFGLTELLSFPDELNRIINEAKIKIQNGNELFSKGKIDEGTDLMAQACRDVISFLS